MIDVPEGTFCEECGEPYKSSNPAWRYNLEGLRHWCDEEDPPHGEGEWSVIMCTEEEGPAGLSVKGVHIATKTADYEAQGCEGHGWSEVVRGLREDAAYAMAKKLSSGEWARRNAHLVKVLPPCIHGVPRQWDDKGPSGEPIAWKDCPSCKSLIAGGGTFTSKGADAPERYPWSPKAGGVAAPYFPQSDLDRFRERWNAQIRPATFPLTEDEAGMRGGGKTDIMSAELHRRIEAGEKVWIARDPENEPRYPVPRYPAIERFVREAIEDGSTAAQTAAKLQGGTDPSLLRGSRFSGRIAKLRRALKNRSAGERLRVFGRALAELWAAVAWLDLDEWALPLSVEHDSGRWYVRALCLVVQVAGPIDHPRPGLTFAEWLAEQSEEIRKKITGRA